MLSRIIGLSAMALALQGCVYGVVNDANTGSAISAANVRVISGSCSGAGCGAAPVTEVTTDAGLYVFDAYGDRNGAANVKLISPASGQEAIRLSVQKPGYISRTVYHRPKYQEVMNEGKNYLISSTGCSGGKHKIPVTVGYVPNPTPPTASSASTTLEAKCSK